MSAYSDLIIAGSPSLYWALDATTGATDLSGNGRNGTGGGSISIGGFSGSGIYGGSTATDFDGSNDRITSTYAPFAANSTRSFCGWANRTNISNFHILFGGDGASTPPDLYLNSGDELVVWESDFGATRDFGAFGWPGPAQWVFWAFVWNDSGLGAGTLYFNGTGVGPSNGDGTHHYSSPGNFVLGDSSGSANAPWLGPKCHVAVFEYALSADQVRSYYAAGIGPVTLDVPRPPLLTGPGVETTLGDIG